MGFVLQFFGGIFGEFLVISLCFCVVVFIGKIAVQCTKLLEFNEMT